MGQIDLPRPFTMQTTPRDLEYQTALAKVLYPQNIPTPFFYPKSPQALRGLGDNPVPPPNYNGGCVGFDYPALARAMGVENCGVLTTPGDQYACELRNLPKINQIEQMSASSGVCITPSMLPAGYVPTPGSSYDTYLQNQVYIWNQYANAVGAGLYNPNAPAGSQTGSGTQTPSSPGAPHVSFTTSRGTMALQPGDTWTIRITGAQAGNVVSVKGNHNGIVDTNVMGVTDANGNFTLTGGIDASLIGNWSEEWFAGSQSAGSFSFTVSPTGSVIPPTGSGTGTGAGSGTGSGAGSGTGSGSGSGTPAPSTDTIGGIPSNYVMLGGAALLMLVMLGGRR